MKLLHVVGMSAWFGTALAVSIIWSKQDKLDLKLILDLISKVEMPASFFIPLTGVLMTIDQTFWLSMGWIQLKIMLGLIAVAFSHISRSYRWQYLLEPLGYKISFLNSVLAIFSGYLINYTIPRSGDIARGTIVYKYEKIPIDKLLI